MSPVTGPGPPGESPAAPPPQSQSPRRSSDQAAPVSSRPAPAGRVPGDTVTPRPCAYPCRRVFGAAAGTADGDRHGGDGGHAEAEHGVRGAETVLAGRLGHAGGGGRGEGSGAAPPARTGAIGVGWWAGSWVGRWVGSRRSTRTVPASRCSWPSHVTLTAYVPPSSPDLRTASPYIGYFPPSRPVSSASAVNARDFAAPVVPLQPSTRTSTSSPGEAVDGVTVTLTPSWACAAPAAGARRTREPPPRHAEQWDLNAS